MNSFESQPRGKKIYPSTSHFSSFLKDNFLEIWRQPYYPTIIFTQKLLFHVFDMFQVWNRKLRKFPIDHSKNGVRH